MKDEPAGVAAWDELARGWPIELGARWLSAEWARVTPRSTLTFGDRSAASWMLVDGSEERTGYVAYDLLLDVYLDEALRDANLDSAADVARCADMRTRAAPLRSAITATITTISSYFPGIVWDETMTQPNATRAVRGVIAEVTASAVEQGAMVLAVANVPETSRFAPLRVALGDLGLVRAESAPDTELPVCAGDFENYVMSLGGRRRKGVRRERRAFLEAVEKVTVEGAERLRAPDLLPILAAHQRKYGHADNETAFRGRLDRMSSHGDNVRVLVAEKDGRAVGFIALILDAANGRVVPRLFGCVENDAFLYFSLVFYEPMRVAGLWGFPAVSLGSTAYRAKLLRGARLHPRATWFAPLDERLRGLVEDAAGYRTEIEMARRRALAVFEA